MELNEFIASFAEQFDETDSSEINADTKFHELDEWGSLVAMSVMAMVRIKYGKTITGTEMHECITVENLYRMIESK